MDTKGTVCCFPKECVLVFGELYALYISWKKTYQSVHTHTRIQKYATICVCCVGTALVMYYFFLIYIFSRKKLCRKTMDFGFDYYVSQGGLSFSVLDLFIQKFYTNCWKDILQIHVHTLYTLCTHSGLFVCYIHFVCTAHFSSLSGIIKIIILQQTLLWLVYYDLNQQETFLLS